MGDDKFLLFLYQNRRINKSCRRICEDQNLFKNKNKKLFGASILILILILILNPKGYCMRPIMISQSLGTSLMELVKALQKCVGIESYSF